MTTSALVMAGGRSDRMRAGGCTTHKALRTIGGMPLIEWNLRMLRRFNFEDIWVAAAAQEQELHGWLNSAGQEFAEKHRLKLRIIGEDQPLGTVGAAGFLRGMAANVFVLNVDNLTDLDVGSLVQHHVKAGAAATVAVHEEGFRIPFGQVTNLDGWLTEYVEKPQLKVTISSGAYVLHPRAISLIPTGARTDVPDLLNALTQKGEGVACFSHHGWWIDVNDEVALARAEDSFKVRTQRPLGTTA